MNRRMEACMHRWIHVRMDGGRDEWMDGWMDDGWING